MSRSTNLYKRYRFPSEIIQYAVWTYHRFSLSHRDIEDLLAERGITVSYESIRPWCNKFGPKYAKRLKRRHQGFGDTFYIDEVFVKIGGKQQYLWRAVDQDGEVVDVFLQARRVQFIQSWSPLGISQELSDATNASLCVLEMCSGAIVDKLSRICSDT